MLLKFSLSIPVVLDSKGREFLTWTANIWFLISSFLKNMIL